MKHLLKKSKIYLLAFAFTAFGSIAIAQPLNTSVNHLDVVGQLEDKIAELELEMLDLKSLDKKSMTKKEKKAYKIKKRHLRRTLARYNDQLDRLTSPRFVGMNPYYGYGNPYGFYRPIYRRQVVVAPACPAPAVVRPQATQRPIRKAAPRKPVSRRSSRR